MSNDKKSPIMNNGDKGVLLTIISVVGILVCIEVYSLIYEYTGSKIIIIPMTVLFIFATIGMAISIHSDLKPRTKTDES